MPDCAKMKGSLPQAPFFENCQRMSLLLPVDPYSPMREIEGANAVKSGSMANYLSLINLDVEMAVILIAYTINFANQYLLLIGRMLFRVKFQK